MMMAYVQTREDAVDTFSSPQFFSSFHCRAIGLPLPISPKMLDWPGVVSLNSGNVIIVGLRDEAAGGEKEKRKRLDGENEIPHGIKASLLLNRLSFCRRLDATDALP